MKKDEKTDALKKIRDEVWALECPLSLERRQNGVNAVLGEGSHDANVMFIGEAPGKNEAEQGRPFCGAAGRVLDELLASINMPRESVYITNIVKDRPTQNRDPSPEEIDLYAPFLDRQIEIIQPKIIATLGRFSMQYLMNRYGLSHALDSISKIHGQVFSADTSYGKVTFVPLYHPAVALYNGATRDELKEDFKVIKKYLEQTKDL